MKVFNRIKKALPVFVLAAINFSGAHAQLNNWTNGGGDSLWTNPLNWSPSGPPPAINIARFTSTVTTPCIVDTNINVNTIDVQTGYTGTIIVQPGHSVDVVTYQQADGTFQAGDSTMSVTGNFTLTGGTFLATSGSMQTDANFTINTGGNFLHNNGTVIFDGSPGTVDVDNRVTFYNLRHENRNTSNTPGDTIEVLNHLNLVDGIINFGALNIQDSMTISPLYSSGASAQLSFTGSGNSHFIVGLNNDIHGNAYINKSSVTDTVFMEINGIPDFGAINDTLFVNSGSIGFVNSDFMFDYQDVILGPGTQLIGASAATRFFRGFTNNGGRLIDNGGDIIFASTGPGNYTFGSSDTIAKFWKTGNGTINMAAGDTLTVTDSLQLSAGQVNGGVFRVLGDVVVELSFDGGSPTVEFGGSGTQNFYISGGVSPYDGSIIINKPDTHAVVLQNVLNMFTPGVKLEFVKGLLRPSSTNYILVDDSIGVVGGNDSSYVDGPFRYRHNLPFTFPVGDQGVYAPITISAAGTSQFEAEYFRENPNNSGADSSLLSAGLNHVSLVEYWQLNRLTGLNAVVVEPSFGDLRSQGIDNLTDLRVVRWDGGQWADEGNASTTGTTAGGTVLSSGAVTNFSPFTLASASTANLLGWPGARMLFIGSTPSANTVGADTAGSIALKFSETVDQTTADSSNILIYGSQSGPRFTGFTTNDADSTVVFTNPTPFKPGETVWVTMLTGLTSDSANALDTAYSFSFITNSVAGPQLPNYFEDTLKPDISDSLSGSIGLHPIDMDGDSDMDIVVGSNNMQRVAWLENDGNQVFTQHVIANNVNGCYSVYAIDLDQDGDIDVISGAQISDTVEWYENDGAQNFTRRLISNAATSVRTVIASDLDQDGDIDVLSANSGISQLAFYENDGAENFTPNVIASGVTVPTVWSVYTADLDNDGDIDILDASNGRVNWHENDGAASFTIHLISDTLVSGARSVHAVDVDGDTDLDVLSASFTDNTLIWYSNDGNQNFTRNVISDSAANVRDVNPVDIDADGDIDLLAAHYGDNEIALYENDGSQNFTMRILSSLSLPIQIEYTDLDRDGDLDILGGSQLIELSWLENTCEPVRTPTLIPGILDTATEGILITYDTIQNWNLTLPNQPIAQAIIGGPFGGSAIFGIPGLQYTSNSGFENAVDSLQYTLTSACGSTDTAWASFYVREAGLTITIYNAVSPDGNGRNDYWHIDNIENFSSEVYIYNKWGEEVARIIDYDNSDPVKRWNATRNGKPVTSGVYNYFIQLNDDKDLKFDGIIVVN